MKLQQPNEKKFEYLKKEFLIYLQKIIDDLQDQLDLVDQILKFSIEYEILNILLPEVMQKMTKIIGWKYEIMYSWSFTVMKTELFQN